MVSILASDALDLLAQEVEEAEEVSSDEPDQFNTLIPPDLGPQMFFDAETTEFSRDGKKQVFSGDVVAVGNGVMLTADKISMDREKFRMVAEGHVVLLTSSQVFLGDKVTYATKSGDFLLINSTMIANDNATAANYSKKLLGFSPIELAFQAQRNKRLNVIEQRKDDLRDLYILQNENQQNVEPTEEMVDKYSLLLEQQDLMSQQDNPFFARMSKDRRRRYKARRLYWERGLKEAQAQQKTERISAFFRIDGKELIRKNNNDYEANEAYWTPCMCAEDEEPAWGLRASSLEGHMGGYIDFFHPVLEIKGVPVLYLPYLKVPVKETRQSGLLMPTLAQRSDAGNIYSQPIYFALDKDYDMTLTTEIYEKRGTKLGVEARYQQKQYSGWTLNVEGIRDRQWNDDLRIRHEARKYYYENSDLELDAFCESQIEETGKYRAAKLEQCSRQSKIRMSDPGNLWRSAETWNGMSILAPRLTFVSDGRVYSDHRYVEDLTLYEDFQSALEGSSRAAQFATVKHQTHLDNKNFYAGVGGSYGDSVLGRSRFYGQQLPIKMNIQSRLYSIDRGYSPIPLYGQLKASHLQISDFQGDTSNYPEELVGEGYTLGRGDWEQVKFDQISPLYSRGIVKVDQFLDWEVRKIRHSMLNQPRSTIESWKTGITINLPIDGDGKMPGIFQSEGDFGTSYLRHYMNWALTFSVRPEVKRTGVYGRSRYLGENSNGEFEDQGELVYFASDRVEYVSDDGDVSDEDTMVKHKRVSLATSHTWDLFDRGWEKVQGKTSEDRSLEGLSYRERARRELIYSLDQPVPGFEKMFSEEDKEWYINRYHLTEKNKNRIVTMSADINYDFDRATRREEVKKERAKGKPEDDPGEFGLPQPWSEPKSTVTIYAYQSSLVNTIRYNLYLRKVVAQEFSLGLPSVYSTKVNLGYKVGNDPNYDPGRGTIVFVQTQEHFVQFKSSIIPYITLSGWLGRRTRDTSELTKEKGDTQASVISDYQTVLGAVYSSPSNCWALAFQRQKKYYKEERDASYLLELSVLFMGRARAGNIGPGIIREVRGEEES